MDQKKGIKAHIPLWLAPTQVRFIPVSEEHINLAMEYAADLNGYCIRADVDDRSETVQKKIRNAEKQWTPYSVVLGDREIGAEKIPVRVREDGKIHQMSLKELSEAISEKVGYKPFRPLPLPVSVQRRPKFVG